METTPIHWYEPAGEWGWMCNLSQHGFTLDDRFWATAEHYYQAHKFTARPDIFDQVAAAPDPFTAKDIARAHDADRDPDWYTSARAYDVMKTAVRAKFAQHSDIAAKLVSTGTRVIIERTDNDSRWGDGPDGTGTNWAGKILMEVRDELRTTKA